MSNDNNVKISTGKNPTTVSTMSVVGVDYPLFNALKLLYSDKDTVPSYTRNKLMGVELILTEKFHDLKICRLDVNRPNNEVKVNPSYEEMINQDLLCESTVEYKHAIKEWLANQFNFIFNTSLSSNDMYLSDTSDGTPTGDLIVRFKDIILQSIEYNKGEGQPDEFVIVYGVIMPIDDQTMRGEMQQDILPMIKHFTIHNIILLDGRSVLPLGKVGIEYV